MIIRICLAYAIEVLISLILKSCEPIKIYYSHWSKIWIGRPTLVGIVLAGLEQNPFFETIILPNKVTGKNPTSTCNGNETASFQS